MATIEINEGDAARPHPASPGDNVNIRLPESPSSGYRWQLDTYDRAVLKPAGDDFAPAADARTGGGGTREFRFVVESSEHCEVALSLRRAWETDMAPVQRFHTSLN